MTENYCSEHETVWFKKGKMKGYAHPLLHNGETVGWCNRPDDYEPNLVEEAVKQSDVVSVGSKSQAKYKADPDKTASIELQVCLKVAGEIAVALINAGILKEKVAEKTLSTAKDFASLFNENS